MHRETMAFVTAAAESHGPFASVLDIGGRDVNGSPRKLFAGADYLSIDLIDGRGVDVVADVLTWRTEQRFACVLCLEVLEHNAAWRRILDAASALLAPGGVLVVTCAGPARVPHSAFGGALRPGEYYDNVTLEDLRTALAGMDIHVLQYARREQDVQAIAKART